MHLLSLTALWQGPGISKAPACCGWALSNPPGRRPALPHPCHWPPAACPLCGRAGSDGSCDRSSCRTGLGPAQSTPSFQSITSAAPGPTNLVRFFSGCVAFLSQHFIALHTSPLCDSHHFRLDEWMLKQQRASELP